MSAHIFTPLPPDLTPAEIADWLDQCPDIEVMLTVQDRQRVYDAADESRKALEPVWSILCREWSQTIREHLHREVTWKLKT